MIRKILKLLKRYDIFDVISIGIFFLIIATLAFFFLRKTKYIPVVMRISSADTLLELNYARPSDLYIEKIKVNLKEKNLLGVTNAEIIDVVYYPNNSDEKTLFVKINMKAVYNKSNDQYTYNGTPLLIGSFQTFKLGNVKIQGVINSIGEKKEEYKIYKIKGELKKRYNEDSKYQYYLESNQANITSEGLLKYIYKNITNDINLYDNKNDLILKTVNTHLEPAYKEYISNSQIKKTIDYERKRVFMDVLILTKKVNNNFLFRERDHLQIDKLIPIHTDILTLNLTILDIKEATPEEKNEFFSQSQ